MTTLTAPEPDAFRRSIATDGHFTVERLLSDAELTDVRHRVDDILAGRTAFPVDAFDGERGIGARPMEPATVRKLKDLARHDPFFADLARHDRILDLVETVAGPDIKLHASIGWMKPAQIGSPKTPHQDSAYWTHVCPPEFIVCWIAIDDAGQDNGCLHFIQGSNQDGILPHEILGELRVPEKHVDYSRTEAAAVRAGGASFHLGTTVHWSGRNTSDHPRRAVSFAYMSARCKCSEQYVGRMAFDLVRGHSYEGCV
jgi:phytanoyl-CoA hydroxylase